MDPNQPQSQPQQAPQPYPQHYQQAPPRVLPYSKAWQTTKIVFYSLSIIFSIIVLGISIALVVNPNIESIVIIWTAPQVGIALCWDIAELITICARNGHRGIHPGAHVALHLLLWLGISAAIGLTGYWVAFIVECDYYCRRYSRYYSYYSGTYVPSMQALLAFLCLLILVHFFLFVRACVETAQRNRLAAPVIMVPQHMYYAQQPMAQYPVQPGYPNQPQQAHMSGYYGQPQEVQNHFTGSTHVSQPSAPTPVHDNAAHPTSSQHA
ncbi:hypothetical protein JX265_013245 [Neoarthrinium moseri]|uniref:Uncharacterized protein n=1 Tax=Neoarthrinium moseri TaxID=1658444 RepID=A0A9Q0AHY4_9PEZI|nr:uncharacterized protein JN550_006651 [Neoarthrinium moseri]KAI1840526.1 hypothetical protein JX266_013255 [Neoarthrinium moseri]KAI1851498.1 hypothetical protein JX265_013245 [Neoarthrinium moseri]KAI1867844.1 hypothetical protein JN550_006651 [Neoarthrinium moseri]